MILGLSALEVSVSYLDLYVAFTIKIGAFVPVSSASRCEKYPIRPQKCPFPSLILAGQVDPRLLIYQVLSTKQSKYSVIS